MMDKKLLIGGIIAALLIAGGVGYAVMKGGPSEAPKTSPSVPAQQLTNEKPPSTGGSTGGDTGDASGNYKPTGEGGR